MAQQKTKGTLFKFEVLRFLRKERGLTIEDLARKSGVSFALISKLERNKANPSLSIIRQLAASLEISSSELVSMAESRPDEIRKEDERHEDGFHFRRVQFNNVKIICATGKRGSRLSHPEVHEDDTEIVFVKSGRVRIGLPTGDRDLSAGEAVQFDALLPHAYEVLQDCDLVIVHTRKEKRF